MSHRLFPTVDHFCKLHQKYCEPAEYRTLLRSACRLMAMVADLQQVRRGCKKVHEKEHKMLEAQVSVIVCYLMDEIARSVRQRE